MAKLTFKNSGLRAVLAHTKQAKVFRRSYDKAIEAYEAATGKTYEFDTTIPDEYYESNEPTLLFVKDEGIYIMTSAKMEKMPEDKSHVVYAEGYSPDVPDCWDKCRDAVGGDDFVETIELTPELEKVILHGADLVIDITPTQFSVTAKISK